MTNVLTQRYIIPTCHEVEVENILKQYNFCCCVLVYVCCFSSSCCFELNGLRLDSDLDFCFHNYCCFNVTSYFRDGSLLWFVSSQLSVGLSNTSQFSIDLRRKKLKNYRERRRLALIHILTNGINVFAPTPVLKFPFPINIIGVHNLTGKEINISILKFLALGEKFIFKPKLIEDNNIMYDELLKFHRRARLRDNFYYSDDTMPTFYTPNPTFQPSRGQPDLESYLKTTVCRFEQELLQLKSSKNLYASKKFHLHNSFRICIASLKASTDLVILRADKGLGLVCVCQRDYSNWILNHLWMDSVYHGVSYLPSIPDKFLELESILVKANLHDKSNVWKYILQQRSSVVNWGHLYFLVKVHKNVLPPPLRPICSQLNTVSYYASRFISKTLVPLVKAHVPTYFDDPIFIVDYFTSTKFDNPVVLAAADIESLYPSINITDGLLKMKIFLLEFSPANCELILDLLQFILYNNFFEIESVFFQQISGVAMGTPCAVMFSVIYVHMLETETICAMDVTSRPIYLCRYIDDFFGIFPTVDDAKIFFELFNSRNISINVSDTSIQLSTINGNGVNFLDFSIKQISDDSFLCCRLYYKPLSDSHHPYIHFQSEHPDHVKKGFILSELNRFVIRSSYRTDCLEEFRRFYHMLIYRGYPKEFLDMLFDNHKIQPLQCSDDYKGKRLHLISCRLISKYNRKVPTKRRPLVYKRKAGALLPFNDILSTADIETGQSFSKVFNSSNPVVVTYGHNYLRGVIRKRHKANFNSNCSDYDL